MRALYSVSVGLSACMLPGPWQLSQPTFFNISKCFAILAVAFAGGSPKPVLYLKPVT